MDRHRAGLGRGVRLDFQAEGAQVKPKPELLALMSAALRGGSTIDELRAAFGGAVDALPCTCPSGDGSLRHPCALHPQTAPVDALAQFIRTVDGNHSMGAGALAEAICGQFTVSEIAS